MSDIKISLSPILQAGSFTDSKEDETALPAGLKMNLREKEISLGEQVAYPSVDEYGFDGTDAEMKQLLADAVNKILAHAFETASAKKPGMDQIVPLVYKPLRELQRRYHDFGLCAPKIYCTIARFWGLNYGPELYLLMRFPPEAMIQADRRQ